MPYQLHLWFSVKYVPEWFPGAGFQKTVKEWKTTLDTIQRTPFEFTKAQVVSKQYEKGWKCITHTLIFH